MLGSFGCCEFCLVIAGFYAMLLVVVCGSKGYGLRFFCRYCDDCGLEVLSYVCRIASDALRCATTMIGIVEWEGPCCRSRRFWLCFDLKQ